MGIYDVVNDQDVAMHYRAISNTVSHLEVFDVSKAKGWSDFLSYVQSFGSKDLSIWFSRGTQCEKKLVTTIIS